MDFFNSKEEESEVRRAYLLLSGVTALLSSCCTFADLDEIDMEFLYPLYRKAEEYIDEYDKFTKIF